MKQSLELIELTLSAVNRLRFSRTDIFVNIILNGYSQIAFTQSGKAILLTFNLGLEQSAMHQTNHFGKSSFN